MQSEFHHQPGRPAANDGQGKPYPWLKCYPAGIDWFQSFTPSPLPSLLDNAVARFGGRPATGFFGRTMTYAGLARQVNRTAKGLHELGVRKGTRVGLLFPNCPAFAVYYYAILKAGGTVVNFNPLYSVPELTYQAKDAGARDHDHARSQSNVSKGQEPLGSGNFGADRRCTIQRHAAGLKGSALPDLQTRETGLLARGLRRSFVPRP